ncbi:hypothetical protein QP157_09370 [Sphingomonas sp. LR61]|uniref:hypothetical protein n=1 Tax=Sphingomonas sp. LR61 TaxID=3050234 RepID=UPI002FE3B7AD
MSVVTPQWLADGPGKAVFERFHTRTPGSMVRNAGTWPVVFGLLGNDGQKAKDVRAAVHRAEGTDEIDGYVTWRVKEDVVLRHRTRDRRPGLRERPGLHGAVGSSCCRST